MNASNYRHWDESIRAYFDDCIRGADGPLAQDYNMRWIASLVADALSHSGARRSVSVSGRSAGESYAKGRLRLMYEAEPNSVLSRSKAGG